MLVLYFALFVATVNSATVSIRNTTVPTSKPTITASVLTTVKSKRGAQSDTTHPWNTKAINHSKSNNPGITQSASVQKHKSHLSGTRNPQTRYGNVKTQQNAPYGKQQPASSQPYRNMMAQASSSGYQNGFRPTYTQTATTNSPVHYANSPTQQTESEQKSHLSLPYYETLLNNPKVYNILADGSRASVQVKQIPDTQAYPGPYHQSQNSLNDKKVLGASPSFGDFASFYTNLNHPLPEGVQSQIVSPNAQVPVYNRGKISEPKAEYQQMYAASYQPATHIASTIQVPHKVIAAHSDASTVDVNGKKVPVPVLQLQSAKEFPGFLHALENQPLVLGTNVDYQAEPIFEFNFGRTKPNVNAPYSSPIVGFQAQVVPIQTSTSPQFPQYRGASVNAYPGLNHQRTPTTYEAIQSQPHLHFGADGVVVPVNTHQAIYHTKPAENIREDVEVIKKKKKPTPPPPEQNDNSDEELDEGYKQIEREYGRSPDEDESDSQTNKYQDGSRSEGDFKPSKSYPFKVYDEKFGKFVQRESKGDAEEPHSKYQAYSSDEDDDDEGETSRYHVDYSSSKPRYQKYDEEESGEETQKRETQVEADENSDYEVEPREFYRGKDFDREFEESYTKELPRNEYVHVKEVPEIDESTYLGRSSIKSSRNQSNGKNKPRARQEDIEEPKSQGSRSSHSYRTKPRRNYGDSDGHGSAVASKKAPKVVHEEFFGYKPTDDGFPKYSKRSGGKHASGYPSRDSYGHVGRTSYKAGVPKTAGSSGYANGEAYSYSSGNARKSSESKPEDTYRGAGSIAKDSTNLHERFSFPGAGGGAAKFRSLTTEEVLRTLEGI